MKEFYRIPLAWLCGRFLALFMDWILLPGDITEWQTYVLVLLCTIIFMQSFETRR